MIGILIALLCVHVLRINTSALGASNAKARTYMYMYVYTYMGFSIAGKFVRPIWSNYFLHKLELIIISEKHVTPVTYMLYMCNRAQRSNKFDALDK